MTARRLAAALALGLVGVYFAVIPPRAGAAEAAIATPVVMVHGYSSGACPGSDVGNVWSSVYAELATAGWTGPLLPVSFYACDFDGVDITGYGPQPPADATTAISSAAPRAGYTDAVGIEQLAHDLAWFLYDTYTSIGTPVDLLGASMGGLIIRYALYRVASGDPDFPPSLDVARAVTLSTPHSGVDPQVSQAQLCGTTVECLEMASDSAFITDLTAHASDPQGTGGTAWTVFGSSAGCDLVPAASALAMAGATRVDYTQPCYAHADYLYDGASADDARLTVDAPSGAVETETTAEHSLPLVRQVLMSAPGTVPAPPPDTAPPSVTLLAPSQLFGTARTVHIDYRGSDAGSGIADYDLRYRSAAWNGGFGAYHYPSAWQGRTETAVSTSVNAGTEYCYSVRAHDQAGNSSAWSPQRCIVVPLDDRALDAVTAGWTRQNLSTAYAGTISETNHRGATLQLRSAHLARLAIIVVECPHCGHLGINLNGTRWRTVNTYAAQRHPRVLLVQPGISARTATVSLVNTDGKNTIIDGISIAH